MFPGLSPVYMNPQSVQTNVPPVGNDPGWNFAQSPNIVIPGTAQQRPTLEEMMQAALRKNS